MSFCAINSPRSVVSTWTICPAEDGRRFPENSRAVNVGTCFPPRLQTEAIVAVVCTSKKLHSAREARTQRILAASIGEAGLLPVARSVRRRHCLRVSSPVPFWFGGGNECGAVRRLRWSFGLRSEAVGGSVRGGISLPLSQARAGLPPTIIRSPHRAVSPGSLLSFSPSSPGQRSQYRWSHRNRWVPIFRRFCEPAGSSDPRRVFFLPMLVCFRRLLGT
jgi:hypothetical protein